VCLFACAGTYAGDTLYAKSKWMDNYPKHVGLTYTVGADVVSNYIWRGIQVAGLSVQPDLAVGYGGAYIDVWGSVGATNWAFIAPEKYYFDYALYPELDITIGFCRWGLDIKYMHMYYFDKYGNGNTSRFFDFRDPKDGKGGITQEWRVKYRVSNKLPLHVMWCTRTWGRDGYVHVNENGNANRKRAYSSYLEVGYEFALPYEMTLFANLGMTPWKSFYTGYQGDFAVVCLDAKLQRSWELSKHCYMNAFAQVMLNPYDMSRVAIDKSYQSINKGQQILWNVGCGFYLK